MKKGILYVLHGRREKISRANLELIETIQKKYPLPQRVGFLEGDQQTLEQSVLILQKQVDTLLVVPVLLFSATHVRWDLPRRLKACCPADLTFEITAPLGSTQAVFDFLRAQFHQGLQIHPEAMPVLVAHGTGHFKEPFAQLQSIGDRLATELQAPVICSNYIGKATVTEVLASYDTPLLVQPLFLTDGRIVNNIKRTILKTHPNSIFLPTLEDQPALQKAIMERLESL